MKKSIVAHLTSSLLLFTTACSFSNGNQVDHSESERFETESSTGVQSKLTITQGNGEVYPYNDRIKSYLQAPTGSNVAGYVTAMSNQAQSILLSWECNIPVERFILRYGIKGCAEHEMVEVVLGGETMVYELYNLYKATEYDWSVKAELDEGAETEAHGSFYTTDLGPRTLKMKGVYNTRDAGGYATEDGKRTKQGLLFRGGELPATLHDESKVLLGEILGIKTEIDLRGYVEESGYRTESPIPNASLKYIVTDGYMGAYRLTENFRQVFSLMSNQANYPMYVHCTGGADRTGTVIFLVNALLGVSEHLLIQDYEFTSFSKYGERNSAAGTQYGDMFQAFLAKLKTYEGETLAQKTASYMLSIGVTHAEIDSIRAILLEA